jgi:hypothetical protein
MGIILGAAAFIVLFAGWVVVPTIIRKRHEAAEAIENKE